MEARAFGRYQLGRRLGAGGMAVVYQALLTGPSGFNRPCVVKRIHPRLAHNGDFAKMFASEARLSALLQHPNIVQILEFGAVEDELFLAMEYIDGADLLSVIRRCIAARRLPPIEVACFAVHELASALAYAHALTDIDGRPLSIVHRDVSPSNVMLTRQGSVKLVDFGIAKAAGHIRDDLTRTGTLKGKVGYMSPEQAEAEPIDRRSDIFSLGVVFHEMLTCQRVFRGQDDLQTLKKIREANPPPPSRLRPEVPPQLDAVVLRMLTRRPEDRYQWCEEVVDALSPIVHELKADGRSVSAFLASLPPAPEESPAERDSLDGAEEGPPRRSTRPIDPTAPDRDKPGSGSGARRALSPEPDRSPSVLFPAPPSPSLESLRALPLPAAPPARRRLTVIATAALVALGVAGLGSVIAWRVRMVRAVAAVPPPVQVAPPPEPVVTPLPPPRPAPALEPPAPPPPERPAQVTLEVTGSAGAQVFEGEHLLGTLPLEVTLDATPGKRVLAIKKPGYRTATRTIAGAANAALEVHLDRERAVHTPAPADGILKNPFE